MRIKHNWEASVRFVYYCAHPHQCNCSPFIVIAIYFRIVQKIVFQESKCLSIPEIVFLVKYLPSICTNHNRRDLKFCQVLNNQKICDILLCYSLILVFCFVLFFISLSFLSADATILPRVFVQRY